MTDVELVLRAADFAATMHRGQERKDEARSPYINHPVRVAAMLAEVGAVDDAEVLAAALLHDTVEDTVATHEEIRDRFGETVHGLVREVSDDTSLKSAQRKQAQIEGAAGLSPGAVLIKLADKTCNIEDIINSPPRGWSLERRARYLDWAEAVIDRCAPVNAALESGFRQALARARRTLEEND